MTSSRETIRVCVFLFAWNARPLHGKAAKHFRKILAPIKIKSALPPPPPNPKIPPPKSRNFMDMGFFPAERAHFFQATIKLAQPFSAPELRTKILRTRGFFWKKKGTILTVYLRFLVVSALTSKKLHLDPWRPLPPQIRESRLLSSVFPSNNCTWGQWAWMLEMLRSQG